MKRRPAFTLLLALLFSSLALTLTGYVLRQTVAAEIPQLQEGPALSVPLTLLRDKSILKTALPENQETLSKPGTVTVPAGKNEEITEGSDTTQNEEKDPASGHIKIPEIDEIVIPEGTETGTEGGGTAQAEEKMWGRWMPAISATHCLSAIPVPWAFLSTDGWRGRTILPTPV